MASSIERLGSSLIQKSPLLPSSSSRTLRGEQSKLCFPPALFPLRQRRLDGAKRVVRAPVAATVTERVVKVVAEKPVKFKVRAALTVRKKKEEDFREKIASQFDAFSDKIGRNVVLELVSTEIDPWKQRPKTSNKAVLRDWFEKKNVKGERVVYTAEFIVDSSFGVPGAITVLNRHRREFFLEGIIVEGFACGAVHFSCYSWVQPTRIHPNKRVFFSNKPYLPSETPPGLKELRERELKELRGGGAGERKATDRIYDYATYNDLGNPDKGIEYARPVLGGEKIPYPRRCRTGRPPTDTGNGTFLSNWYGGNELF